MGENAADAIIILFYYCISKVSAEACTETDAPGTSPSITFYFINILAKLTALKS